MNGRWQLRPRGERRAGTPWLVLRGSEHEAVQWNGPVLELVRDAPRLGPDILGEPPDYETMLARLRADPAREVGDALLDQRLVAGIGNIWKAESLWQARVSPWRRVVDVRDEELRAVLEAAHEAMRASVVGGRRRRHVYRRVNRACPRCGTAVRSRPQGEDARTAYWCPGCQE